MTSRAWAVAIITAASISGCASSSGSQSPAPFTDAIAPTTVRILVDNRNFSDARLYTLRRGSRRSLGIVGGKQERTFTIDWPIADQLAIEINLLAGPTCVTEELPVNPGEILELSINVIFTQSSACR